MRKTTKPFLLLLGITAALSGCRQHMLLLQRPDKRPLHIVVMDPHAAPLACRCVEGCPRRDYGMLEQFLESQLRRPVHVSFAETLAAPVTAPDRHIDLIVGEYSVVVHHALAAKLPIRTLAMLTGRDGAVTRRGLFVVRNDHAAKTIADLAKHGARRIVLGPPEAQEKSSAALAILEAHDLQAGMEPQTAPSCRAAALKVLEKDADVAVISSCARQLLAGRGTVGGHALRVVGATDPVPFNCVFATKRLAPADEPALMAALLAANGSRHLRRALGSREGFVPMPACGVGDAAWEWTDWRGNPQRSAVTPRVPRALPLEPKLLWKRTCTGPAMSGLAVAARRVIVADKDTAGQSDIWHCLDADTGAELWRLVYPAPKKMDYTNSPRANPVVNKGLVYLLSAFGDLHCVELMSGKIVWKRNLLKDFHGELPMWGTCSTPLVDGNRLIVNPGGTNASVVALDRTDGELVWQSPGEPAAYGSFVIGTFGGIRQIIGHDAVSLGGWDPRTGRRLWRLVPPAPGDFNVPTPLAIDDRLLVATENNGTRLYAFDRRGIIRPDPLAVNNEFAPDTSTPVLLDGRLYGSGAGLFCLDLERGLQTLWRADSDRLCGYCSLIAGNQRVMIVSDTGQLLLVRPNPKRCEVLAHCDLLESEQEMDREIWSHPVLVGNRLYARSLLGVYCFLLP